MDFIPERSEIQVDKIEPKNDKVLKQMIKDLNLKHLVPGMKKEMGKRNQQWIANNS